MKPRSFAIIGAGGVFTCGLFVHMAREARRLRDELRGVPLRFMLMDIDPVRLDRVVNLARRVLRESGFDEDRVQVLSTTVEDEALAGADMVLYIRAFRAEESRNVAVARRFGIVSGHEGPASIGLARFALPAVERAANALARTGQPGARLIVFANPTDVLAQAVAARTGCDTWGWCGAPDGLRETMASLLNVAPERITRVRSVGVNHFSYVTELELDGVPALPRLREMCANSAASQASARMRVWMEWVRDTGWPYLTIGHPAPWNEPPALHDVWTNPEAPAMLAAVDGQLHRAKVDCDLLLREFGWEGSTGLAMTRVMGAFWGGGDLEIGWQHRHDGNVPGLPTGGWLERTMGIRQGTIRELDFNPLPEGMECQLSLLALQHREMGRAIAEDDPGIALRALALNPYSCPMPAAREYIDNVWRV